MRSRRNVGSVVLVAALVAIATACTPVWSLPGTGGGGGSGGGTTAVGPTWAGCPVFPADNAWNTDISTLPVRAYIDWLRNAVDDEGGWSITGFAAGGSPP